MLLGAAATYTYLIVIFCILGLFIGFCVFLVTLTKDLKNNLNVIEKKIQSRVDQTKSLSSETDIEIIGNLCKFIRFNSDAKQLSGIENIFQSLIHEKK